MSDEGPYELGRFLEAQENTYSRALVEIQGGRKRSHWMWFIFPQIAGLGWSATTVKYAINSTDEARAYLEHSVLGERLREITGELLKVEGKTAHEIFDKPDDMKLRSSMTLFDRVAEPGSVFDQVLEKFFGGERDERTIEILEKGSGG